MKTITQTTAGFEARYQGKLIASEATEAQAREKLNEYVYDLERGRIVDHTPTEEELEIARAIDDIRLQNGGPESPRSDPW